MANLLRPFKSGNDWFINELLAYHFSDEQVFFGPGANPSLVDLDHKILTAPAGAVDPDFSDTTARYLCHLDLAANATQESLITDFARETLHLLGFSERNLTAQTNLCLLHRRTLVLLVFVEDKTLSNPTDAQSQVIAAAISAFQFNNSKRESLGCEPLPSMTIPCITMSDTRPTFYLVFVTLELSNAVAMAQYPSSETVVSNDGMKDTQYRQLGLQRFLAFKTLAKSHWEAILKDL
ncbi:hypothetical protein B0H11DRAFT_2169964 [Mycena galericulata]|nr:hypothetical protein B0H11DRAFT_2169964 [Mycena galericulata]